MTMNIFVGGSLNNVPREPDVCRQFVAALGAAIMKEGHVLLNGCRSSLDQEIATAAHEWLVRNGGNPKAQIISYCLKTEKPIHRSAKSVTRLFRTGKWITPS